MSAYSNTQNLKALKNTVDAIVADAVDPVKNPDSFVPGVSVGVTNEKETVYLKSAGYRDLEAKKACTDDTLFNLFSTTKAITTTALLQLVERGQLDLDEPVETYLPSIKKYKVITSFEGDTPILKEPANKVTTRHLLTHTAGFGYSFFNESYRTIEQATGQPHINKVDESTFENTHLLFEPGTQWHYGMNIDIAGFVLEEITGKKLGVYLEENIFKPALMNDTTFYISTDEQKEKVIKLYLRQPGGLKLYENQPQFAPALDMGGHGAFGPVKDYLKFMRIWLNDGKTAEGVQILKPETVQYASKNQLPDGLHVTSLPSTDPDLTNPVTFDPSVTPDLWGLGFAITQQATPTGRPVGTLWWAGLSNLYYFIDVKNKVGGFWAAQVYPFFDSSLFSYGAFEKAIYDHLN